MARLRANYTGQNAFFRYIYFPTPTISVLTATILADTAHPLYISARRRAASKPTADANRLTYEVLTQLGLSRKGVVRHHCAKRVRSAWRRVLAEEGYGVDGRLMAEAKASAGVAGKDGADGEDGGRVLDTLLQRQLLRGHVRFWVNEGTLTAKHEDIVQECRKLTKMIKGVGVEREMSTTTASTIRADAGGVIGAGRRRSKTLEAG